MRFTGIYSNSSSVRESKVSRILDGIELYRGIFSGRVANIPSADQVAGIPAGGFVGTVGRARLVPKISARGKRRYIYNTRQCIYNYYGDKY